MLPRALRIPGIKTSHRDLRDDALHFSSRRSKWLDEDVLVSGKRGKSTNWKRQYKLRHNWSIGACEVQEIHVADRPSVPEMLVRLAEGVVVTADKEDGLRAWDLKGNAIIAKCELDENVAPTCLAVDEREEEEGLGIAVGFADGGWGTWWLDVASKAFTPVYRHPSSSNGMLGAVAYAHPYILTITDSQLLSLYSFDPKPATLEPTDPALENEPTQPSSGTQDVEAQSDYLSTENKPQPTLLASLKSHTSWPPLSLSIRTTTHTLIASIAYSLPTYLSGYTIGLQELHLSLSSGQMTFSRLASSLPQGFSSLLSNPQSQPPSPHSTSGTSSPVPRTSPNPGGILGGISGSNSRPTTLSYAHPYILATHPDNTLTLYLCTSNSEALSISPGTKLWGHTSSVSSAEITPRGKAVSVSTRGNELRVWELEGGFGSASRKRLEGRGAERSVRLRPEMRGGAEGGEKGEDEPPALGATDVGDWEEQVEARKQWVGFDDEVVIVLKESGRGTQALMVYDFT